MQDFSKSCINSIFCLALSTCYQCQAKDVFHQTSVIKTKPTTSGIDWLFKSICMIISKKDRAIITRPTVHEKQFFVRYFHNQWLRLVLKNSCSKAAIKNCDGTNGRFISGWTFLMMKAELKKRLSGIANFQNSPLACVAPAAPGPVRSLRHEVILGSMPSGRFAKSEAEKAKTARRKPSFRFDCAEKFLIQTAFALCSRDLKCFALLLSTRK